MGLFSPSKKELQKVRDRLAAERKVSEEWHKRKREEERAERARLHTCRKCRGPLHPGRCI
jgi:hypothetical protein